MQRRTIRNRELLALHPDHVRSEPGAMWWDSGVDVPDNEQIGTVCVVSVRGALEHHGKPAQDGTHKPDSDSYDWLRQRVYDAMCGEETTAVVLRLDTPGGVVSGLNETVHALRRMAEEHGKPLIAHVDGLCASAGYALSCACSEFYLTSSAITGSVGVISMMVSQEKADKKAGIDVVTIKSGARKDDGHVHVPISDAAVAEEQRRVDKLAQQFFRIVARARGLTPAKVQALQAGIFLGKDAVKAGLADSILSFEKLMTQLGGGTLSKKVLAQPGTRESTSAKNGTTSATETIRMTLHALIRQTKAALDKEKDPKKAVALATALASFTAAIEAAKRVKKTVKYEMESTDEGDEDEAEEESEESEEEEESEESEESETKGNETNRKEGDDSDDDGDSDKDDDGDAEEDDEEEEAAAAPAKGKKTSAKFATVAMVQSLAGKLDQIQADTLKRNTSALINDARAARKITPGEAKMLATKSRGFVKEFLSMRKKPIVNVDEESALIPDGRANADLPASVVKMIDQAVAAASHLDAKGQEALRAQMVEDNRKQRSNGAGTRY